MAAAALYAINIPLSKLLLNHIDPTMILGTIMVVMDTLAKKHNHTHKHTVTHTHDGSTHSHTIEHEHPHNHYLSDQTHHHHHRAAELRDK